MRIRNRIPSRGSGSSLLLVLAAILPIAVAAASDTDAAGRRKVALGPTFTKIANNGSTLPDAAVLGSGPTDWACTRHNATGLVFEVKLNNPGALRHFANSYSWLNNDGASNGGNAGTANGGACSGSSCDTHSYVTAVNGTGLCGTSNWRLPTAAELQRLVGFSAPGSGAPVVDTSFFPNLTTTRYWTRRNVAAIPSHAWVVGLDDGNAQPRAKNQAYPVLLVR